MKTQALAMAVFKACAAPACGCRLNFSESPVARL